MVTPVSALTNAVNQYIVRPANAFGLGRFVFDIEGETTVTLKSDITDHFLEDNTTIQDHIAIKPKKVTLNTYVGELTYKPESDLTDTVETVVRKLTTINAYLPELTQATQAIVDFNAEDLTSVTDSLESVTAQTVNKATDYYSMVQNLLNSGNKQQDAYMYFKSLMEQKILVSLQTPFEYMNNMAIESVTAFQGEESKFISNFTITLKEIRTAEILTAKAENSAIDGEDKQGRNKTQQDVPENNGNTVGQAADLPNDNLDTSIDPTEVFVPSAEDYQAAERLSRNPASANDQEVVNLFEAGVITNVSDE